MTHWYYWQAALRQIDISWNLAFTGAEMLMESSKLIWEGEQIPNDSLSERAPSLSSDCFSLLFHNKLYFWCYGAINAQMYIGGYGRSSHMINTDPPLLAPSTTTFPFSPTTTTFHPNQLPPPSKQICSSCSLLPVGTWYSSSSPSQPGQRQKPDTWLNAAVSVVQKLNKVQWHHLHIILHCALTSDSVYKSPNNLKINLIFFFLQMVTEKSKTFVRRKISFNNSQNLSKCKNVIDTLIYILCWKSKAFSIYF